MKWAIATLTLIVAVLLFTFQKDTLDNQAENVRDYFSSHQFGGSIDYELHKTSPLGDSFVAVVFGYMDDNAGCRDIAMVLNGKYGKSGEFKYYCRPVK